MLRKIPAKTILTTLMAWILFWELKESITGDRQFFAIRWLYSDMKHAKEIEVQTYLLSDEQVGYMFTHPNEEVRQPSNKELSMKQLNVVLRIRNLTSGVAWGRLSWRLPGREWSVVDINEIAVHNKGRQYSTTVIPMGIIIAERNNSPDRPIEIKWDELYVYR